MLLVEAQRFQLDAHERRTSAGSHRFATSVDDQSARRPADHCGRDSQGVLEIGDHLPVEVVHNDVRAGLDLGDPVALGGQPPGRRTSGRPDRARIAEGLQPLSDMKEQVHCGPLFGGAELCVGLQGAMSFISRDAFQLKAVKRDDFLGQGQRLFGGVDAGPVHAGVYLDQYTDLRSGHPGRPG